jgi:hypothetical protein
MSLTRRWSEAGYMSQVVLTHALRQVSVSLIFDVRQKRHASRSYNINSGVRFQWFTDKGKHRHESFIRWADVTGVTTFKRDMFAYDLICLKFESSEQEAAEFDEEDVNWQNLMSALPLCLPGVGRGETGFPKSRSLLFSRTKQSYTEEMKNRPSKKLP